MLSSYREEQITKIHGLNAALNNLANGGRKLGSRSVSSNVATVSGSLIIYHKRIQRHARLLHGMLNEKLGSPICKCNEPHNAHLELEIRSTPPAKELPQSKANVHSPNQFLTFSVIFSTHKIGHEFSVNWQEFLLEPIIGNRQYPDDNVNITRATTFGFTPPQPAESSWSVSSSSLDFPTPGGGFPLIKHPPHQCQSLSPVRYVQSYIQWY